MKSNAFSVNLLTLTISRIKKCNTLSYFSEILVRIVNSKNYETVLDELREYLNEVDSEFVKKCISSVGKIAIRYDRSVEKCMSILSWQIKETRHVAAHAEHVVNELIIVQYIFMIDCSKCLKEISIKIQFLRNV